LSRASVFRIGLFVCLFAIVVGGRWGVINQFGTDLPQWDQWDAEGLHLLVPWFQHRFTLAELFFAHNEHRVVLTKLLNLTLTLANGQWDQRLESVVNAFLAGLLAVALFWLGTSRLAARWHGPLFVIIAAGLGLPLAWQNVIAGFHSQQFFLIGLSFGAIVCLGEARPWSRAWWLGAICAVLALGSMATGFLASLIVICILSVRVQKREIPGPATTVTLFLCTVVAAVGWFTRVTVGYHDGLKAQTAGEFALSLIHSLQWPMTTAPWTLILLWLPWSWLALRTIFGRPEGSGRPFDWTLTALGGWVIAQLLATAYARGVGGDPPASRYIDTLVFGAVVNAMAAAWLVQGNGGNPAKRTGLLSWKIATLAWAAVFADGVYTQAAEIFSAELPPLRANEAASEQDVRDYLATGDESYLASGPIPYPGVAAFLERIRLPELRFLLPVSVRTPLALTLGAEQTSFISHDSRPPSRLDPFATASGSAPTGFANRLQPLSNRTTWGSFGGGGAADIGVWTSAPLTAAPGWLMFQTAGQLGEPGVALELRDASTHELLAAVSPTKVAGDSWRAAYARAPRAPFIVVARDQDAARWLAFAEPVEMGPLSHWAWRAAKQGWLIAEIAAGVALLLGAASWRQLRRSAA
jgi:hypothetical protein